MKLEHFALNVEDPIAITEWYVAHLGLSIARQTKDAPYVTFLADDSGNMMIEFYHNSSEEVLPFREMHPMLVHLAFVSEDPGRDRDRLVSVGASLVTEDRLKDGSHIIMLRDPWGLPIQMCKRGKGMLKSQI